MTRRDIPNAITIGRMVMALPLLWLLVQGEFRWALGLALVAGLSDAVDGFLAKRYGWQSELGGLLDPLADKLLLCACFLGLWLSEQLPTWLVAVVLVRDLVILAGARVWWSMHGRFRAEPSGISKANTLLQLVLVALVMAQPAGILKSFANAIPPLVLATAAVTVVSGLDYIVRYGRKAWLQRGGRG
jgi:cardiolipin synthase